MRKLTDSQQQKLADHLSQKPFKYIEFYREILDHYAAAYEAGTEDLDTIISQQDEIWTAERVAATEAKFYQALNKEVRRLHWKNFRSVFRWPYVMTSLAMMLLLYIAVPMLLDAGFGIALAISMLSIAAVPVVLLFWVSYKRYRLRKTENIQFKEHKARYAQIEQVGQNANLGITIMQLTISMPRIFFEEDFNFFIPEYAVYIVVIYAIIIAHTYASLKVFRTKLDAKLLWS